MRRELYQRQPLRLEIREASSAVGKDAGAVRRSDYRQFAVQEIDTTLVLKVLEPIWATIPETAYRLRGRIEAVLDSAKVRGYRSGENPARWRGHLDKILPKVKRG